MHSTPGAGSHGCRHGAVPAPGDDPRDPPQGSRNRRKPFGIKAMERAGIVSVRYGPAQLARLLGLPEPTAEQAAVISAPLGPLAVIAGAGSGKSETMAARLVWLVANGIVRPDRVLGLTFTRKAAAELADRVRGRLDRLRHAGLGTALPAWGGNPPGPPAVPAWGGDAPRPPGPPAAPARADGAGTEAEDPFGGDPVVCTYHAYAGRLVADNALREGLEPSMRLITPAVAWQIAARIVAAYDGAMDSVPWSPQGDRKSTR